MLQDAKPSRQKGILRWVLRVSLFTILWTFELGVEDTGSVASGTRLREHSTTRRSYWRPTRWWVVWWSEELCCFGAWTTHRKGTRAKIPLKCKTSSKYILTFSWSWLMSKFQGFLRPSVFTCIIDCILQSSAIFKNERRLWRDSREHVCMLSTFSRSRSHAHIAGQMS